MYSSGCAIPDVQFRMHRTECTVPDVKFQMHSSGCTVPDAQCTVLQAVGFSFIFYFFSHLKGIAPHKEEFSHKSFIPSPATAVTQRVSVFEWVVT